MISYTPIEYICMDIAKWYGLDKYSFEQRIKWVKENHTQLESLVDQAEDIPMYRKAVSALRELQAGNPTGHLISMDSTCSGMQILSTITGCIAGAIATGLIENQRADAYSDVTREMNKYLSKQGIKDVVIARSEVKRAVMTLNVGVTI